MMLHPKLRALDVRPIQRDGQAYLLLRDPQQLSEQQLLVPQPLGAVLAYADGRHDVPAMVEAFQRRYRFALPIYAVHELVEALDEAIMLDNERALERRAAVLAQYRQAPYRPAAFAGASYPAEQRALGKKLQDYLAAADNVEPVPMDWSRPVGLLSPHIDYPRGGPVYAQVWKAAAQAARTAELVVIFGTDHYGSDLFTLTRQNYATPFGVLPTETRIVDRLAQVIGPEAAFAGELRHRGEHSLELVAVWLHHMRQGEPAPVVPILVGSFHRFWSGQSAPAEERALNGVLQALSELAAGRRTLIVASGDLAHVGPAFGGAPLDAAGRQALRAADDELVAAMQDGDAAAFLAAIGAVQDRNNVCGTAPIYLTMQLAGAARGRQFGYATCPADDENTSVVTVTGMLFA